MMCIYSGLLYILGTLVNFTSVPFLLLFFRETPKTHERKQKSTQGNSNHRQKGCETFVNFSQAEKEFKRRCMALNLASETLGIYKKCLHRLLNTCIEDGLGTDGDGVAMDDITVSLLRYHFAKLLKQIQPITVRIHYRCLHTFFTFLHNEGYIKMNHMERVEKPRVPQVEIQAFSHEQINTLLNIFDKNTFSGYRNYCITCMLFGTGIRRSEATKIKLEDVLFDIGMVKIQGKGSRQRKVPISDTLRKVLMKYLRRRKEYINEKQLCSSPYLFITIHTGAKMSGDAITSIYNTIGRELKLKGVRVSPHTFRHTFAKFFLLNGGDVFTLQRILGHADISTTKQYVNMNASDIRMQNDKYNPLECDYWKYGE